jgi:hypothetical protein
MLSRWLAGTNTLAFRTANEVGNVKYFKKGVGNSLYESANRTKPKVQQKACQPIH